MTICTALLVTSVELTELTRTELCRRLSELLPINQSDVSTSFCSNAYVAIGQVKPDLRSRVAATDVVRISRTIDAPIRFVYGWCTDLREDDYKISGSKSRRRILEKTGQRVIYTTREKGAKSVGAASVVTLHPPNTWHVDSIGDQRDTVGDYRLTRLCDGRTRLDIVFKVKRKSSAAPGRTQFLRHLNKSWDRYVATLDKDYEKRIESR